MATKRYIDFEAIKTTPNKYDLTIENIKKLVIKDWAKLKKHTWHNDAMKDTGSWWCHLEGCQEHGKYNEEDEFWIGFREDDNKIDCHFTCHDGMCRYVFDKFYDSSEIENKFDMYVQVNTIKWLNKMIDNGVLAVVNG